MDDWGDWQPPSIQTGLEHLGYNYGLWKTKQRMENEEKKKESTDCLTVKKIPKPIESPEEGSYKESDGRRLSIPICTPELKGWHTGPPRGIELCNATQIEEWKIDNISRIRILEELPQGNSRKEDNQVPMKQNPEVYLKNSRAEVTSNVLKVSKRKI
ncbi:hypothetical protein O181_002144 [Austropuccinia psidii MF-1]|uniref:Uncharacterized protein n=1 Tax=Austropuccinia psidii MF-1 TaxID=1389203 RepID=A0A9Q3GCK4_9BASI|nr:hypothetical protein [Austropuccinia psidii MF-1]